MKVKILILLFIFATLSCIKPGRYTWLIINVYDENGNPLRNVLVAAERNPSLLGDVNPTPFKELTDSNGLVMEWVEAGEYIVEFLKTNYGRLVDTIVVTPSKKVERNYTLHRTPLDFHILNKLELESPIVNFDDDWVIHENKKLERWSFEDPLNPYPLASYQLCGSIRGFKSIGEYAYVYILNRGLEIFHFEGNTIVLKETLTTPGVVSGIVEMDTLLILLEPGDSRMDIYSLSHPSNPQQISSLENIYISTGIAYEDYIFGIGSLYSPTIIYLGNPQSPLIVYWRPASGLGLSSYMDRFYLLTFAGNLEVWEIEPVSLLKSYNTPSIFYVFASSQDTLFVINEPLFTPYVECISLEDEIKTLSIFVDEEGKSPGKIIKRGEYLYVSSFTTLYILELTESSKQILLNGGGYDGGHSDFHRR